MAQTDAISYEVIPDDFQVKLEYPRNNYILDSNDLFVLIANVCFFFIWGLTFLENLINNTGAWWAMLILAGALVVIFRYIYLQLKNVRHSYYGTTKAEFTEAITTQYLESTIAEKSED